MKRGRSLPTRTATVFGLVVAIVLLVVASLSVQLTRRHVLSLIDEELLATEQAFRAGPATADPAGVFRRDVRAWLATQPVGETRLIAVRLDDGVLATTGPIELADVPGVTRWLNSSTARFGDISTEALDLRLLAVPLEGQGGDGTLVVLADKGRDLEVLDALARGVAIAGAAGLLFAIVLGLVFLRRALLPLSRIAAEARAIEETGDLSRRVGDASATQDEIAALAGTFDSMLDRLEGAFERQRSFLAEASHELRTPLTVARGRLELLRDDLGEGPEAEDLVRAIAELDRIAASVEELLLLARLEEGLPLRAEPVEVDLVAREALLRGLAQEAGPGERVEAPSRNISVDVPEGLTAKADPERLLQVLTNLIQNAVQHAGSFAGIAIRARLVGSRVEVDVADTGVGIPQDELPHVFDRHFRARRSREDAPGGSGLGLAIVRSLTTAMGGEVSVSSQVGRGTTFTVSLPWAATPGSTGDGSGDAA